MKQYRKNYTLEDIIKNASYIEEECLEKLEKAYSIALNTYGNKTRESGELLINHVLSVTYILTTVLADIDTLCVGLLHEVDLDDVESEIKKELGNEVIKLIYGVSKISKLHFSTENDYLVEYYKKIIVGMSEDVRVIIIKLADRLHNMRTLYELPVEKQKKKAKETLEIFAPIAHHLGIHKIKSELEDLSLRYLKSEVFYDIVERLNKTKVERDSAVIEMVNEVSNLLLEHNIKHEIKGRAKSIYSIYNKLNKGKKFSDIYDLLALRILVSTEQECYLALGIIHSKFKPFPKRFKDYIAMPKANMYQSLHTTVFGMQGLLFEIQIRTYEMDEIAENGIASHWAYKENRQVNPKNTTEQKLQFFKSIIELNEDKMSSHDFVNSVKDEVLNNNIYCFTPKGDVIELPLGATPIDFAYKVHTRVGETMIGALVNNVIVPLDYELKDNDIVKINTNKNSKGPSKEWLNIVKSTQTKNKIKSFFTKSEREVYIERGKDLLEKELRKRKIAFTDFYLTDNINLILKEYKQESIEELYLHIGNGKYAPNGVINVVYKKEEDEPIISKKINYKNKDTDIIVDGIDKVKVNIASCCNPLPGDNIVGYITKGNGISIHRSSCHNLEILENRTVPVHFNKLTKDRYTTAILVYTNTSTNNILEIVKKVGGFDVNIENFTTISKTDNFVYEIDLVVTGLDQLNKIINEIYKLNYITNVERVFR